jgi:hypothetical protein
MRLSQMRNETKKLLSAKINSTSSVSVGEDKNRQPVDAFESKLVTNHGTYKEHRRPKFFIV